MKRTTRLCEEHQSGSEWMQSLLEAICMDTCELVDTDLVSIWLFKDSNKLIECACSYDAVSGQFTTGSRLRQSQAPAYFRHIVEQSTLMAPDVSRHVALQELLPIYFEPKGILSLLDFIMHDQMVPLGVICCESRLKQRDWTTHDLSSLRAVATLASYYIRTMPQPHDALS